LVALRIVAALDIGAVEQELSKARYVVVEVKAAARIGAASTASPDDRVRPSTIDL